MIAFFPQPYQDELLYSWLARYYVRTGYTYYSLVADDLFKSRTALPRIEYINDLTDDAVMAITKYKSMKQIVLENTMFPYYARFIPREKRSKAFSSLIKMDGKHINLLPVPKQTMGIERKLRYCPICAIEDRKRYGETFWHRTHQLIGMSACPIHNCLLEETALSMLTNISPSLNTAELTIPQDVTIITTDNSIDITVSKYLKEVFESEFNFEGDIAVADLFYSRIVGTPYLSPRGEQRNLTRLVEDFSTYYCTLSVPHISEWSQIQKMMQGKRLNPFEVCLMALFLKISPYDLTHIAVEQEDVISKYDKRIKELHRKGLKYPAIAKEVGGSYDYVKAIGEGIKGKRKKKKRTIGAKTGPKKVNTPELDQALLPKVKQVLSELTSSEKPIRITVAAVEKRLGLKENKIKALPSCYAEVKKHKESQEEFWARKVGWAVGLLQDGRTPINFTQIIRITNMDRVQMERTLPYIKDETLYSIVLSALTK